MDEAANKHPSTAASPLEFLHLLENLKNTPRTGWVRRGVVSAESISDHMYRMAVLCMMIKVGLTRLSVVSFAYGLLG